MDSSNSKASEDTRPIELVDTNEGVGALHRSLREALESGRRLYFLLDEDGAMRVKVGETGVWTEPVAVERPGSRPVETDPEATGEVFYRETYGRRGPKP